MKNAEIFQFRANATRSTLKRIRELQEQTAIANNVIARLQPSGNLSLAIRALCRDHRAPAELVLRSFGINERLVLVITQYRGVRQHDGFRNLSRVYGSGDIHILLQLLSRIRGRDASLQGPRIGIERSRN